jgi:hypothetical protein
LLVPVLVKCSVAIARARIGGLSLISPRSKLRNHRTFAAPDVVHAIFATQRSIAYRTGRAGGGSGIIERLEAAELDRQFERFAIGHDVNHFSFPSFAQRPLPAPLKQQLGGVLSGA